MAQEITAPLFGHFIASPGQKVTLADITVSTRSIAADLAFPARWFMAMIYQKAFTAGTGTVNQVYNLEGAATSAFGSGVVNLGQGYCPRVDEATCFIIGFAPLNALKGVAVTRVANGTDAATFDAVIIGV
jgi:hypothetical protein